jgi:hypothetical protein
VSEEEGGDNLAADAHDGGGGGEEEGSGVMAAAEVTPHKISRCTVRDCSKPVYWDLPKAQGSNTLWLQRRRGCVCQVESKSDIAETNAAATRWF